MTHCNPDDLFLNRLREFWITYDLPSHVSRLTESVVVFGQDQHCHCNDKKEDVVSNPVLVETIVEHFLNTKQLEDWAP